jgi:hypothetical protein
VSKSNTGKDIADGLELTEAPERAGVYRVSHDPDGQTTLSNTVVEAIAEVADVDPTRTVIPLADSIDPDALDALFTSSAGDAQLSFSVCGLEVIVWSDGKIRIVDEPRSEVN